MKELDVQGTTGGKATLSKDTSGTPQIALRATWGYEEKVGVLRAIESLKERVTELEESLEKLRALVGGAE